MSDIREIMWRFLIVEDKEDTARQLQEAISNIFEEKDTAEFEICKNFKDAVDLFKHERFDLIILDLKDDSDVSINADDNPKGLKIFDELKKIRFVPVVFYTALAHKVRSMQTTFVRVVEKTEGITKLSAEVNKVFETKLPLLNRQIEELQRNYMWDFVSNHWQEFNSPHGYADLAFLLARRLALSLQEEARKHASHFSGSPGINKVHPMEIYIRPPISEKPLAGDIVHGEVDGVLGFWVILTPSCDFEQAGRLGKVLLAQCLLLSEQPEYTAWKDKPTDEKNLDVLKSLIGDNRKKQQPERFKFLPGTYFLPDMLVDFQQMKTVLPEILGKLKTVASLDSPYSEAVISRFSRYLGRIGTPDIDKDIVIKRLTAQLESKKLDIK